MLQRIVKGALRLPAVVVALSLALVAAGLYSYQQLDIEAYPNPVAPMIEIITQPTGWSAEEVERSVTIPIETAMSGMIDLDHIRSQSLFGLSDVKCYFNWTPDYFAAQQRVLNRLSFVDLPPGVNPGLSPWSAIGEVFRYVVRGPGYSLTELKTAEDWILERQFRQVPGVIDVVSFGGQTKQYQVQVDPLRLKGQGVTLPQLLQAINSSNQNVGGQTLTMGEQSFNVRGVGLIRDVRDIEEIVIAAPKGTPLRVRDVAKVEIGAAPRLGIVGKDEEPDVVQGTVLMRFGGDSLKTLEGVHERVQRIKDLHLLPPGMTIEPYYDRASLVNVTTHTVLENLVVGMLLVTIVLWLFLGHTRAALVTAVNIPLALLAAFIGMVVTATPANLISLGAVDFGIVIDSTVIMVENIFRHLGPAGRGARVERIAAAAAEVGPPMFFSTLIIAVAFIPLFTMTGVAGIIFSPMAHTYAFAIGGAILLALTLTPVLANRMLGSVGGHADAHGEEEHSNFLMRALDRFYKPLFAFALRRKRLAVLVATLPVVVGLSLVPTLGREFMPKLEEGNFWIRATLPLSVSLEQSAKYVGRMRQILLGCPEDANTPCDEAHRGHPEITSVVSQTGRPDDGTDPSGFYNIELFAPLGARERWRKGVTKETLTDELSRQLQDAFPGITFNFSQMISDNVEEAMSGVKGENTVKVTGPDIKVNETKATEVMGVLSTVAGITDLGLFRSLGQPNLRVSPDRIKCGRYGLNSGDVAAVVQAAVGGQALTRVYEGEKRFDLTVRWEEQYRDDVPSLRELLVPAPDGSQVPLGQIADIVEEEGPSMIYREDHQRYAPVKFSVRGRDLASTIEEAQKRVNEQVKLPYDTHLEWSGEINQLHEATGRLVVIIPLTILLIAFLVFSLVKGWKDMLIVLAGIPVACTGGVLALVVTRTNFSISAAMGFISIFGIAIQDALIVVTYAQRLWADGVGLEEGARLAAVRRLRPVLMTTCVAMLGLLPAALSSGIGSETQKPLAIVVIGGALILAVLPRLLQPALLVLAHQNDQAKPKAASGQPPKSEHLAVTSADDPPQAEATRA